RVQASYRARLRSFFGNGRVRGRVRRSAARPDRISQQRARGVSDGFDLKDYVDAAERIRACYERYPEGSLQTEMVRLEGDLVVFRPTVYGDREEPHATTGWAYEREGVGYVNRTSFIENCETSAIGRALANLSFPTSRSLRGRA